MFLAWGENVSSMGRKGRIVGKSCLLPLWLSVSFALMESHSIKSGSAAMSIISTYLSVQSDGLINNLQVSELVFSEPASSKTKLIKACFIFKLAIKVKFLRPRGRNLMHHPSQSKANPLKCADSISQNISSHTSTEFYRMKHEHKVS